MIILWAKESRQGPTLMLGLLPENVRRLRMQKPIFVRMREISPDCPDWTLSICCNGFANPKNPADQANHVSINFGGDEMDKFLRQRLREIPLSVCSHFTSAPSVHLVLFYTENEENFTADLVKSGITFGEFRDERGRAVN